MISLTFMISGCELVYKGVAIDGIYLQNWLIYSYHCLNKGQRLDISARKS